MKVLISLIVAIGSIGFVGKALACSCMDISNAQQTALVEGAIVARVQTSSLGHRGEGTLKIEKVLKGDLSEPSIQISGQDGANCAGPILPPTVHSWIAIFTKDQEGKYGLFGCADTSLPINGDGKIKLNFSEEVLISEEKFQKLIEAKARPTVKGARCSMNASRLYVSHGTEDGKLSNIDFYDTMETTLGTSVTYAKDLFGLGKGIAAPFITNLGAYETYKGEFQYRMGVRLTEPFFGVTSYREFNFDIRKANNFGYVSMSTYQDINGRWGEHFGEDPFYAYEAGASCALILGKPIVEVN
jgi:hypothetical protein